LPTFGDNHWRTSFSLNLASLSNQFGLFFMMMTEECTTVN
jgi:hypothetical protein